MQVCEILSYFLFMSPDLFCFCFFSVGREFIVACCVNSVKGNPQSLQCTSFMSSVTSGSFKNQNSSTKLCPLHYTLCVCTCCTIEYKLNFIPAGFSVRHFQLFSIQPGILMLLRIWNFNWEIQNFNWAEYQVRNRIGQAKICMPIKMMAWFDDRRL